MPAIAEEAYFKLPKSGRDAFNGVLLFGGDAALIGAAQRKIAAGWQGDEEPHQLSGSDIRSDPAALEAAFRGMSLFGGRRLIMLEGVDEYHTSVLAPLFGAKDVANYVVMTAGSLSRGSSLRAAAEDARGMHVIGFYEESEAELATRVVRMFQLTGLALDDGVAERLSQICGGDRSVLEGEIGKLSLYMIGQERVSLGDVDAICGNASAFDASELAEALVSGDLNAVERSLSAARDSGESGQMLNALKWQLDRMLAVRVHFEQSNNWDQALARARPPVFFKMKDRWKSLLSRVTGEQLGQLQRRLQDAIYSGRKQATVGNAISERFVLASTREMRANRR